MNYLAQIDTNLFYFINQSLANPLFDRIMPFITDGQHWLLLYIFGLSTLICTRRKKGVIVVVGLLLCIIFTDQFNYHIIKELVSRVRPCTFLPDVRLLVPCGAGKSFPSSHALNNFAAASFLWFIFRKYKWLLFSVASAVAFSRVYVGVHYPVDIIGGALMGLFFGYIFAVITISVSGKYFGMEEL